MVYYSRIAVLIFYFQLHVGNAAKSIVSNVLQRFPRKCVFFSVHMSSFNELTLKLRKYELQILSKVKVYVSNINITSQ